MRNEWSTVRLDECVSVLGDGLHGTPMYSASGEYYFINGNNLKDGKIVIKEDTKRVHKTEYDKYKKPLNNRTLLISINGTLGNIGTYQGENVVLGKSACYFNVLDEIEKDFIKYILYDRCFQNYLVRFATGTTIKNASLKQIREYTFLLPPLSEQRAIAATLSCLDDKIELNNKINANLEAQAQAIFKSWFVDFEPFQDGEFVESELGMIPKGWRVGLLSELINVKYGKDHKKLGNGTIPVYGSGGIMRYAEKALYERESVLIPRKGTLNNVIYINEPFWTVDTMFYSEMRHPYIAKFIYFLVSSKNLASMNSGSAVPSMTTDILNNLLTPIAPDSIFYEYDRLVSPLFNAIHKNTKQSNTLAALRDTLLPKLMSGEIEVPMEESM